MIDLLKEKGEAETKTLVRIAQVRCQLLLQHYPLSTVSIAIIRNGARKIV